MQAEGSGKDKKILQVSTSALVGLKAALYTKQQAAKRDKTNVIINDNSHARRVSDKTAAIWKRPNKKVKGQKPINNKRSGERGERVLSQQEEDDLEKSRRALEAKAALYEKLSKGQGLKEVEGQEGEESRYMVDFTKKIYEEIKDGKAESASSLHEAPQSKQTSPLRSSSLQVQRSEAGDSPSEEWVEYEDEFGRTRKCLKSELPEKSLRERRTERSPTPQLLSEDMRRERERVQWEREAEEEMGLDEPVGPVHYQSVQGGEVRSHGIGYYQFSQQEEERQQQMEMLDKLRTETASVRDKKERLKEKRRALLEARLTKVKEKRNEQRREQGLADIEFEVGESGGSKEEPAKTDSNDIRALLDAEMEKSKVNSRLEQKRAEEEQRNKHVRPWDRGKAVDLVRKRKQELEEERLSEFAPPPSYSEEESSKKMKTDIDNEQSTKTGDLSLGTAPSPPRVPSCHGNTMPPPPHFMPPSSSHGNPVPPWFLQSPPYFMAPPPPPFPWQPPPWGQFYPPPPPPPSAPPPGQDKQSQ